MIDVSIFIHHQTDAALLVSDDGEKDNAVWIPKSCTEVDDDAIGETRVVSMPEWLATEKGFV